MPQAAPVPKLFGSGCERPDPAVPHTSSRPPGICLVRQSGNRTRVAARGSVPATASVSRSRALARAAGTRCSQSAGNGPPRDPARTPGWCVGGASGSSRLFRSASRTASAIDMPWRCGTSPRHSGFATSSGLRPFLAFVGALQSGAHGWRIGVFIQRHDPGAPTRGRTSRTRSA